MTYDRRKICKEAARQWRNSERLGLGYTWAKCMSRAWAIAKQRRREVEQFHSKKREVSRDIIHLRMARPWPLRADNSVYDSGGGVRAY